MADPYADLSERHPRTLRTVLAAAILAFLIGLAVMAWALTRWEPVRRLVEPEAAPPTMAQQQTKPLPAVPELAAPQPLPAPPPTATGALDSRLADLEGRMARIDLRAAAAAGNAARAEGLLIAFAARRAVDRGVPLGYLEAELRDRFGTTQPRAVATVIAATQSPVTLEMLHGGLEQLKPRLTAGAEGDDWWQATQRALGNLIVVRREGSGSPAPDERIARAEMRLASGQVDGALAEIARLPGAVAGQGWMTLARRYVEAHRALDVLEAAALTEGDAPQIAPPQTL